jgi:hypothetical protein
MKLPLIGFIFLIMIALPFAAFAQEPDVVVFVDGVEVAIPVKYKVVIIPKHWDVANVYRESHRVLELPTEPVVVTSTCSDELVVSPATCTPAR